MNVEEAVATACSLGNHLMKNNIRDVKMPIFPLVAIQGKMIFQQKMFSIKF